MCIASKISLGEYMIHSILFKIGYSIKDRDFLKCHKFIKKNEYKPLSSLQNYQEERLKKIIQYSYKKIPYYHHLFNRLKIDPQQIQSVDDLEKIPILTKDIIRTQYDQFKPMDLESQRWVRGSTGGSTGEPLQYRMSKRDEILGLAMMYANWGYAGYELGDKVAIIAGSSLYPTARFKFINSMKAFMLNERRISSFDLSEQYMEKMTRQLNQFKPKYIRGYASSIYLFADFIKERKLKLDFHPEGIFTTAEVLFEPQREVIEEVFAGRVFDQYGMNDGGVSAYECKKHSGMHIDMLRSVMEVVDENGRRVKQGVEGHVLATSLHNFAFPFIRYDTKDLGILAGETCTCGRKTQLISKIVGRVSDFIHTPEGRIIHGEFFTHIFWEIGWAKQFQIIQKSKKRLIIKIVPNSREDIDNEDLEKMRSIISNRTGPMELEFEIVDEIETTPAGKWRFIINEI